MNNYKKKTYLFSFLSFHYKKSYTCIYTFITSKEHFKYLEEINSNIWTKLTQICCTEVTFQINHNTPRLKILKKTLLSVSRLGQFV